MDSDILGGYLIPPQQFVDEVIIQVKNYTFIRDLARILTVDGAQSLGIPTLEVDISAPVWTTEIADASSVAQDSSMQFGKRELKPSMLSKMILISNELLARTGRAESLVKDRIAYQYAVTAENAFLNGTGVNQPLGVFTASALAGISTSRDTTTAANNAITGDDLMNCVYSLKAQYQNNPATCWICSRFIALTWRKIKDSQNRYMWEPSIQIGQPPTMLNYPVRMSEYAPSQTSLVASTYAAILGVFSNYYIAEVEGDEGMSIQRLDELYATKNQTGYIMRARLDGMAVLQEAFARLIMHS
jgi:HK97 family phage major capsid protein